MGSFAFMQAVEIRLSSESCPCNIVLPTQPSSLISIGLWLIWVIVSGCFLTLMLIGSHQYSYSILFVEFWPPSLLQEPFESPALPQSLEGYLHSKWKRVFLELPPALCESKGAPILVFTPCAQAVKLDLPPTGESPQKEKVLGKVIRQVV